MNVFVLRTACQIAISSLFGCFLAGDQLGIYLPKVLGLIKRFGYAVVD